MNFYLMSDLHLEFEVFNLEGISVLPDSVLILAGDIAPVDDIHKLENFLDIASKKFQYVVYVAGNHEFYYSEYFDALLVLSRLAKYYDNVYFLNNEILHLNEVSLIGSTLWSSFEDGDLFSMLHCQGSLNDYRKIRRESFPLVPSDTYKLHLNSVEFLSSSIENEKKSGKKVIVVSHHLPSLKSIAPRFQESTINGAFASDLDKMILKTKPDIWCHGHTHTSFDYKIGETQILCNPKGYKKENTQFNPTFNFSV